jgi:predicted transposase YdaD
MTKKSDLGGKRLISLSPDAWVNWIMQSSNLQVIEILSSEFQWIGRDSDVLIKVYGPDFGEFLILNELQLRYKKPMHLRMRAYTGLAAEKYNLPVYPVLINILPNSQNPQIPTCYESEFMGIKAYQDYRVINLWEVEASLVFEQELSTLLPFVPILKGGGNQETVQRALRQLRTNEQLTDLEPLLSFFASFVLQLPLVQQIMRWDMIVLEESPWYQQIFKEGEKRGLQQGLQQGETSLVLRLLTRRFGELESNTRSQISNLSVEKLELLAESLLDFSSSED